MNIKLVETLTGMTRSNIRFYETEGFIQPERLSNGYREYSDEDVEWVYNINTKGTMYCTRAVLKNMIPNNSGSIINLDSVAGAFGTGGAAYVSSKAAIIGLTKHNKIPCYHT